MKVSIIQDYITVGQLLKHVDLISSGGAAKLFLKEIIVEVNGQRVFQRGKKLFPEDIITVDGTCYHLEKE